MKNKKRGGNPAASRKGANGASDSPGNRSSNLSAAKAPQRVSPNGAEAGSSSRTYKISDNRLERPEFHVELVRDQNGTRFIARGGSDAPPPPIRESKYLKPKQCVEIYRWMLLNRRM